MRWTYWLAARGLGLLFRLGYRVQVLGRENIPAGRPLVLASNHQSNLDPPLIGAFFPREIGFVAKKQLFVNPMMNKLMRHFNSIPIDRNGLDLRALREIRARLEESRDLLVFPEGTRSRDGRLGHPRPGLGLIISAPGLDVDVLPVLVLGSRSRPGLPGFRPVLRLEFGPVLTQAELQAAGAEEGEGRGRRADALTRLVFSRIEALYRAAQPGS